jgi:hypothetical protein
MKRENGYYWVKFKATTSPYEWVIAHWHISIWLWCEQTFSDDDMLEIEERRILLK